MTVILKEVPASELRAGDRIRREGLLDIVREAQPNLDGLNVDLYLAYAGRTKLPAGQLVKLEAQP